jgi:L-asparaginase II
MEIFELDIVATRGGTIESRHAVHAAIVASDGRLVGAAREPATSTFWRSCAKPFQVMPLLESGGFDEMGWGDDELALACASHGGEPEHVSIAASMLSDLGLEEGDLACGPHEPLAARGAKFVRENGVRPTRLHNNCSGKHAAMLARATTEGWATVGYERANHPVQVGVLATIASWANVPAGSIAQAVDGCGVVVFGLPLVNMATAYARLAGAVQRDEEIPRQIVHAMTSRPFLVGGTDRFDSILIEETNGRVLAKVGAEGVHTVAALDLGLGIAVKAQDGAQRAQYPAVLRALQLVGALPDPLPQRLADFIRRPVRNTRGEVVGEVHPAA